MTDPHNPNPGPDDSIPPRMNPGDESIMPGHGVNEPSWHPDPPATPDNDGSVPPRTPSQMDDSVPPGPLADDDDRGFVDFSVTAPAEDGGSAFMPMPIPTDSGTGWAKIQALATGGIDADAESDPAARGISDDVLLSDSTQLSTNAPGSDDVRSSSHPSFEDAETIWSSSGKSHDDEDAFSFGGASQASGNHPPSQDSFDLLIAPGEQPIAQEQEPPRSPRPTSVPPVRAEDSVFGGGDSGDLFDRHRDDDADDNDVLGRVMKTESRPDEGDAFSPTSGVFSMDDIERADDSAIDHSPRPGTTARSVRSVDDDDADAFPGAYPEEDMTDPLAEFNVPLGQPTKPAPEQAPLPEDVGGTWHQSSAINLLDDSPPSTELPDLMMASDDPDQARDTVDFSPVSSQSSEVLEGVTDRGNDIPLRGRDFDYQDSGHVDLSRPSDPEFSPSEIGLSPEPSRAVAGTTAPAPASRSATPWLGGGAVGFLAGTAATAALYFAVGRSEDPAPVVQPQPVAVLPAPVKEDPKPNQVLPSVPERTAQEIDEEFKALLNGGDFAKAQKQFPQLPEPLRTKELELTLNGVQSGLNVLRKFAAEAPPDADDADLKQAITDLGQAATPTALIWKGALEAAAGQRDAARKTYEEAAAKHPEQQRVFEAALDRLDVLSASEPAANEPKPADEARGPEPDARFGLELFLTLLQAEPDAAGEPEEAGFAFWKAMKLAKAGQYAEATELLKKAKAAHNQRRLAVRRGLNPQSDPLEEIFLVCADQLQAYWKLRAETKPSPVTDDALLTELAKKLKLEKPDAAAVVKAVDAALKAADTPPTPPSNDKFLTELAKKLKVEKPDSALVEKAIDATLADVQQKAEAAKKAELAMAAAEKAKTDAEKRVKDLTDELDAAKDPTKAEALTAKLTKQLQKLQADKDTLVGMLSTIGGQIKTALKQRSDAEAQRDALAKQLTAAKKDPNTDPQMDAMVKQLAALTKARDAAANESEAAKAALEKLNQQLAAAKKKEAELQKQLVDARKGQPIKPGPIVIDPVEPTESALRLSADRLYSLGATSYFGGDLSTAEAKLNEAIQLFPNDARYHYFRGLTRLAQGRSVEAETDFRNAAALESRGLPAPREVSTSLERVQAYGRSALNQFRP